MKQRKESNGADKVSEVTKRKLAHAAIELAVVKKWTIADFLRLFFALLIPAGMIFVQYYFWVDLQKAARENINLLIEFMEIITGLVILYGLNKTFAIRSNRAQLVKAEYEILSKRINTEEKIESLEKKATKWELSDFPEWILSLLISGGIVYSGFQDWFLERFQLPVYSEYTSWLMLLVGAVLFVWLMVKSREEKKEKCAAEISQLREYL